MSTSKVSTITVTPNHLGTRSVRRNELRVSHAICLLWTVSAAVLLGNSDGALAGPNSGGTLFVHASIEVIYSAESQYCDSLSMPPPSACSHNTSVPGDTTVVFGVFAALPEGGRLSGLVFGWQYNSTLTLVDQASCGDFELPNPDWPASGSGTAITWLEAQTDSVVLVY